MPRSTPTTRAKAHANSACIRQTSSTKGEVRGDKGHQEFTWTECKYEDEVAEALLKHETVSGDELAAILRGDNLDEYREAKMRQQKEQQRARRPETETEPDESDKAPESSPAPKPDVGLSGA